MHRTDESELIRRVIRGDSRSEAALYARYSASMFRVCLRYARDRHEAEDILQEGFLLVFTDLKHFRFDGSFEGWVRKVMVRTALRVLKQRRQFEQFEEASEMMDCPKEFDLPEASDSERIAKLMQQLPPGYRTVLNLYAIEGYSHEEIASLLPISVGTSKSQLFKARNMLKKLMESSLSLQL